MARGDKGLVACFSMVALLCSVLSISAVLTLKAEGQHSFFICAALARDLGLQAYVIVLSVVGLLYGCTPERYQKVLRQIYSSMLVVLGISFLVIGFLLICILPHPDSKALEGSPKWFCGGLVEGSAWTSFTTHMKESKFCENPASTETDFQMNCCQAPPKCMNGTTQEPISDGAKNNDCPKWSNNQDELCFGCDTCKKQVVDTFTKSTFAFMLLEIVFYGFVFMFGWLGFA